MRHNGLIEEEASDLILVVRETELKKRVLLSTQLQNSLISFLSIVKVTLDLKAKRESGLSNVIVVWWIIQEGLKPL